MFIFPMAEVAIARQCFSRFCGSSRSYGCSHHQRQRETFDCHAFKSNRQKECVQMPGKMARSDPRPSARVTRGAGSGQHLASVLQESRENANIDAGLGFIWRISVQLLIAHTRKATIGTTAIYSQCERVNLRRAINRLK